MFPYWVYVIRCIFKWVTIKEHLHKVQLLCYVMPSRNDYVWHKLKSMAIYNASSILCITFPFLLFNHPSSSSFNTLPVFLLSPFCPLIHSPILFFLCCLYCSIPFSFQEPIHPCITHSVTCWWITVDVLSLTWWEISVTFSKGHHMNTQQTDALCPVPCTLACTHKGTHFHLTLSSGANEGTVKDLYTFPCLSFCSCLPSRFFFLNYKKRHSPLQHIPCIHFSLIIPSGFCLCIFLVRPVEILLLFAVLNFFFPFLLLIFVLSGQVCFCQKVHAPKGICSSNTLCMYVNVCISLVLATSLF